MKTVKVRTQKNYSDASNHVLVGSVIDFNKIYVRLHCKSFHYKAPTLEEEQVVQGEVGERIVPWNNIECINVLSDDFNWQEAALHKCDDGICLKDGELTTLINRFKTTHR
jgi:hypothetical protein